MKTSIRTIAKDDVRKIHRDLYASAKNTIRLVHIPPMKFLAAEGMLSGEFTSVRELRESHMAFLCLKRYGSSARHRSVTRA